MSVNKRSKFKAGVIVFLGFCPVEAVISRQFQRDISLMPSVIYACPGQIGKLAVLSIILYSRSITFCRTKCITSERFIMWNRKAANECAHEYRRTLWRTGE